MEPVEYPPKEDVSESSVDDIMLSEEEKEEQEIDVETALMTAFGDDVKSQGLEEDLKKARDEHPDLYVGSIRDKFFAFRPLYWDERLSIDEQLRKGEKENFTPEDLVRMCVIVGLDAIIGKRARAGIWQTLALRVEEVGDYDTDLPANANPRADDIPLS